MAGLFVKDFRLITSRKSSILLFILIGGMLTIQTRSTMGVMYMTMFGTLLALGTIAYDDADNCMTFLMTLPCTRKEYVYEKYGFILAAAVFSELFGVIMMLIGTPVVKESGLVSTLIDATLTALPIVLFSLGVLVPLQLKYGPEKSRIAMLVIFGSITGIIFFVSTNESESVNSLRSLADKLNQMNPLLTVGTMVVFSIVVLIVSVQITVRIMENKEF